MTGKRPVFSVKGLSQFTRDQIHTPMNYLIHYKFTMLLYSLLSIQGLYCHNRNKLLSQNLKIAHGHLHCHYWCCQGVFIRQTKDQRKMLMKMAWNKSMGDTTNFNWKFDFYICQWKHKKALKEAFLCHGTKRVKLIKIKTEIRITVWLQVAIPKFAVRSIFTVPEFWSATKEPGMDHNWDWM